jgi:hypothetical protein
MHAPRDPHLNLVKRILRYVKGTLDLGMHFSSSPTMSLTAYTDANWASCPDTCRSTSGYYIYLGDNLISWSSKRQATVSRSSAEAEDRAVTHVVAESCWVRQLLGELYHPLSSATVLFCDNVSTVYMASNPVQHRRANHIEIDIHFVQEKVSLGQVHVLHVSSAHQYADIMTKGLSSKLFSDFRSSLCVHPCDDIMTKGLSSQLFSDFRSRLCVHPCDAQIEGMLTCNVLYSSPNVIFVDDYGSYCLDLILIFAWSPSLVHPCLYMQYKDAPLHGVLQKPICPLKLLLTSEADWQLLLLVGSSSSTPLRRPVAIDVLKPTAVGQPLLPSASVMVCSNRCLRPLLNL